MIWSRHEAHNKRGGEVRRRAVAQELNKGPSPTVVAWESRKGCSRLTPVSSLQYTARAQSAWGSAVNCSSRCKVKHLSLGGSSEAVPPVPIPNTAVKRLSADDTAPARTWENKSLPGGFAFSAGEYGRIETHHRLKHSAAPPYPHPRRLARIAEGYDPGGELLARAIMLQCSQAGRARAMWSGVVEQPYTTVCLVRSRPHFTRFSEATYNVGRFVLRVIVG